MGWYNRTGIRRVVTEIGIRARLWLLKVGVVFLLVGMSRGERRELSLGVRIRARVPVHQAHDHGGPSIMETFKRMAPPSF
ncbi:hypothetical protein Taro_051868 [Colocasia esculenta]|uniref:Uncharacterized protein n=1 Tax=Colocasia esculenta TaxID=4460 RepID=A0A843XI51_COLES|nr:hypothetical protein [Colocasia esculenta]